MLLYHTLYLVLGLAVLAHALVIQPSNHSKRASAQSISILDKMGDTSVNGACKFPPILVLHDFTTFVFFKECNRQFPIRFTPHASADEILCMGLYEIGDRLCNIVTKYHLPKTAIPSVPDFKQFISDPNKKETDTTATKLCLEFGSLTSITQAPENKSLDAWNIMRLFTKNPQVCPQICSYVDGESKELCRLILWGNRQLASVTQLAASIEAIQSQAEPAVVSKSVEVPAVDESHGVSGTGAEQSSSIQQGAQNLPQDLSNPKVSSRNNSQNSLRKKLAGNIDDQKPDSGHYNDGSKHSEAESTNFAELGDHSVPADSPKNEEKLSREREENQTPLKSSGENTKEQKEEKIDLSPKKLGDLNQETKLDKQDKKEKDATAEEVLPPGSALTTIAPKKSDETFENTASNPSNDATLDTIGADYSSNVEEPIVEPEDEDSGIDPAITKAESINDDENRESNPSKTIVNPEQTGSIFDSNSFEDSEDSHFFRYFMTMVVICIFGYLLFHNKQKILALFLEGRSRRGTRRRPNTANYHKLDCNLEEAVSSPCSTSVAHVIY